MESLDDIGLLRQYATGGSEAAFETLVNRRIGFVYSAALRQVSDPQLAEEITQTVFVILAQKARRIPDQTVLTGWLFNTTRFTALAQIRAAAKRRHHEQELQMGTETETESPDPLWKQISPLLDEALATLGEKDRRALLLRFCEDRSLAEVGNSLGSGEEATRKRVSRALGKLHEYFLRRGVSSTSTLVGAAISTYSVHAAPPTLAKSVAVVAMAKGLAGGGSTIALTKGALKLMTWSKAQTGVIGLAVIGLTTVSVIQHRSKARLFDENQSLRQQIEGLQTDSERLSNLVAQAKSAPTAQSNPSDELLRLRGEVGVLRSQSSELKDLLAKAQNGQTRGTTQAQQAPVPLPEDYPKTAEAATKSIFDTLARGDLDAFFTSFAEPGVPKEMYDKMLGNERVKSYLAGLEVVSVGQPTNSFGPNMWFVPYTIRLQDGSEKQMQLHVAQDPSTKKWAFKGGI